MDRLGIIISHICAVIFTPTGFLVNIKNWGNIVNEVSAVAVAIVGVITSTIIAIYWFYKLKLIIQKYKSRKCQSDWSEGT